MSSYNYDTSKPGWLYSYVSFNKNGFEEYAFVENSHVRLIIVDEIIFQHTLWLVDHWPLYGGGIMAQVGYSTHDLKDETSLK